MKERLRLISKINNLACNLDVTTSICQNNSKICVKIILKSKRPIDLWFFHRIIYLLWLCSKVKNNQRFLFPASSK